MIQLSPKHEDALTAFRAATKADGPLDLRDQVLVRLTVALLRHDDALARSAQRQAAEVGLSDDELGHVAAIVALHLVDNVSKVGSEKCCCSE